jgi:hypothetical protein
MASQKKRDLYAPDTVPDRSAGAPPSRAQRENSRSLEKEDSMNRNGNDRNNRVGYTSSDKRHSNHYGLPTKIKTRNWVGTGGFKAGRVPGITGHALGIGLSGSKGSRRRP